MRQHDQNSKIPRTGILGGTFDPVHQAHLAMARRSLQLLELETVHFLVSASPPHKFKAKRTSPLHRYAMVSLATQGDTRFRPSTLELEEPGIRFTIETLARFCQLNNLSPREIVFIAGGDSLRDFHLWKEWERLLDTYFFLFVLRPGIILDKEVTSLLESEIIPDLRGLEPDAIRSSFLQTGRSALVDLEMPDISSTKIRHMLELKQDCRDMIPPAVLDYIEKMELYGGQ